MGSDATERVFSTPLLLWRRSRTAATGSAQIGVRSGGTDEQLLSRAQQGDREALSALFDRYADLAFTISFRILSDQGEAEDLVQDVILKLFGRSHSFDPDKGSARTWIVQYRRAFDRRAWLARRCFYSGTESTDSENANQETAGAELEDQIAARLTAGQLMAALNELTEPQRTTIEKFFFEGASLREISDGSFFFITVIKPSLFLAIRVLQFP